MRGECVIHDSCPGCRVWPQCARTDVDSRRGGRSRDIVVQRERRLRRCRPTDSSTHQPPRVPVPSSCRPRWPQAECAGCGVTAELQLRPCAVVADSTFQVIPVRIDLIAWVRRPPTHSEACRCRGLSWKAARPRRAVPYRAEPCLAVPCRAATASVAADTSPPGVARASPLLRCQPCMVPPSPSPHPQHTRAHGATLLASAPSCPRCAARLFVCCAPPRARSAPLQVCSRGRR